MAFDIAISAAEVSNSSIFDIIFRVRAILLVFRMRSQNFVTLVVATSGYSENALTVVYKYLSLESFSDELLLAHISDHTLYHSQAQG